MTQPTEIAGSASMVSGDGQPPTLREGIRVWLQVAMLSFGGPTAQVAVMHRLLVDEKKWISESRFLHALNYCMLLPGPEAQQLATYLGWMLHGIRGGIIAGVLFVVPGFLAIFALSWLYVAGQQWTVVSGLFLGIKPAVVVVVAAAVQRLGRRVLHQRSLLAISVGAFVALHSLHVPFPLVILVAAGIGATLGGRWSSPNAGHHARGGSSPSGPSSKTRPEPSGPEPSRAVDRMIAKRQVTPRQSLFLAALCLALWWLPLAGLWIGLGPRHPIVEQGLFFSRVSVVTFGGAYSVLSYVQQRAVQDYGWVTDGEMIDGLGMAESTPGPLIQVVQFVSFLGAYRAAEARGGSPLLEGLAASVVTTWVTYVPCFLWIFLGAPYIERLRGNVRLNAALAAVTAAVVGVVFHLAVTFALQVLFREVSVRSWGFWHWEQPHWSTWNGPAMVLMALAAALLFWAKRGILFTLGLCCLAGIIWQGVWQGVW